MSHYFSSSGQDTSKESVLKIVIDNVFFTLYSGSGIFSRSELDQGTKFLLQSITKPAKKVLDVGCGCGVMGIYYSLVFKDSKVDMIDVNEYAIELTNKSIVLNNLPNARAFVKDMTLEGTDSYDFIMSNPPIRIGNVKLAELFSQCYKQLKKNGELRIVIRKKQGANAWIDKLSELFEKVTVINKEKGYFIISCLK